MTSWQETLGKERHLPPALIGVLSIAGAWVVSVSLIEPLVAVFIAIYTFVPWLSALLMIALRKRRGRALTAFDLELVKCGYPCFCILLHIINGIMAANSPYWTTSPSARPA